MPNEMSYAEVVWSRADSDPCAEVLRCAHGTTVDAGGLRWRAGSLGTALKARYGVGVGDVVVTCVEASPEAVALTAAISAIGAVEFPLPSEFPVTKVAQWMELARPKAVVASALRAGDDLLREISTITGLPVDVADANLASATLPAKHPGASALVPVALPATAPALIMLTSGTTGSSKAAVLPVGAVIGQARRVASAMQYQPGDVLVNYFPWHHINARNATTLPALLTGARVVMAPRFSASGFWQLACREGITAFNFMGALCAMLLRQPPSPLDRSHTVTKAYGGPAPADLVDAFNQRFGVILRQAYACTELGDVSITPLTEVRPGAAGRPVSDHLVRIVDDQFADVPAGVTGEILVKPQRPGTALIKYLGDPDATANAWVDGWFRTRDRGHLTGGWLYITGRTSDVIRRRGINIDPMLIEGALLHHPDVADAAAIAVPSELTEDEVLAIVVPFPGRNPPPETIWKHCKKNLPRHAVPRYVSIETTLPHTGTHKLDRARLRCRGLPPGAWDTALATPTTRSLP